MSQFKELSEEELIRRVDGDPVPPKVRFYTKAHLDHDASRKATEESGVRRRIYKEVVMVEKKIPGQTDWAPAFASKRDFEQHPAEYEKFLRENSGEKWPGLDSIPALTAAELQYLRDLGYSDIQQVALSESLPEELAPARAKALILYKTIEEMKHGHEEGTPEASGGTGAGGQHLADEGRDSGGLGRGPEAVPAPRGQQHGGDVGQPPLPPVQARGADEAPEGLPAGGRLHGGAGEGANGRAEGRVAQRHKKALRPAQNFADFDLAVNFE